MCVESDHSARFCREMLHLSPALGGTKEAVWNEAIWHVCVNCTPSNWSIVHPTCERQNFGFLETSFSQDFSTQRRKKLFSFGRVSIRYIGLNSIVLNWTISNPILGKSVLLKEIRKNILGASWHPQSFSGKKRGRFYVATVENKEDIVSHDSMKIQHISVLVAKALCFLRIQKIDKDVLSIGKSARQS